MHVTANQSPINYLWSHITSLIHVLFQQKWYMYCYKEKCLTFQNISVLNRRNHDLISLNKSQYRRGNILYFKKQF